MRWRRRWLSAAVLAALTLTGAGASAAVPCAIDDTGQTVCLERPARRIVALSPSLVELVYAAGAGEALVGAVSFSDYPPEAAALPRVGGYDRLDLEALLALEPDLVLAWESGNPREQLARLAALGVPIYVAETRDFEGVAASLERLGRLAGREERATAAAEAFRAATAALRAEYRDAAPVTVFYQVWEQPLMTISADHWISEALTLCGGVNVFAEARALVPRIAIEAVLARDPEVVLTGGMGKADSTWLAAWRAFPELTATRRDNLFFIDPDLVQRATPRLLAGTRAICTQLERARERR